MRGTSLAAGDTHSIWLPLTCPSTSVRLPKEQVMPTERSGTWLTFSSSCTEKNNTWLKWQTGPAPFLPVLIEDGGLQLARFRITGRVFETRIHYFYQLKNMCPHIHNVTVLSPFESFLLLKSLAVWIHLGQTVTGGWRKPGRKYPIEIVSANHKQDNLVLCLNPTHCSSGAGNYLSRRATLGLYVDERTGQMRIAG